MMFLHYNHFYLTYRDSCDGEFPIVEGTFLIGGTSSNGEKIDYWSGGTAVDYNHFCDHNAVLAKSSMRSMPDNCDFGCGDGQWMTASRVIFVNSLIGYVFNGTLIYLIRQNPKSQLGNYRYLLLLLAIFNLLYATDHLFVIPVEYTHDFALILYSSSFLSGYKFMILFCGWSMHKKLNSTEIVSDRRYRLQRQLFQCLIIQFIVPIILEYIPCTAMFLVPMMGMDIDLEYSTIAISLYAVFEPVVVIYFVREYRLALLGLFRRTQTSSYAYSGSNSQVHLSAFEGFAF
ncbi:unnamed protein product, partial [Mesorhabditis belari]|uniref:G protein-coupled receptor n=1 Tax=Mesorhabditis belari TaxID=2138241 RepID=A0AAF3J4I6_9BILA